MTSHRGFMMSLVTLFWVGIAFEAVHAFQRCLHHHHHNPLVQIHHTTTDIGSPSQSTIFTQQCRLSQFRLNVSCQRKEEIKTHRNRKRGHVQSNSYSTSLMMMMMMMMLNRNCFPHEKELPILSENTIDRRSYLTASSFASIATSLSCLVFLPSHSNALEESPLPFAAETETEKTSTIATTTSRTSTTSSLLKGSGSPIPNGITTVILDSPQQSLGVQIKDVPLGPDAKVFPVVTSISSKRSTLTDTTAATASVSPGMVILGQKSTASLIQRLKQGPYPYAIQFYDLSVEFPNNEGNGKDITMMTTTLNPQQAFEQAQIEAQQAIQAKANYKEPPVSAKGAGLGVKTIRKVKQPSDCAFPARRGDRVTIQYEARVASPGGPIYDSTEIRDKKAVTFELGDGKAIPGVDIGIGGMCQGEVRELDIPASLGYGRFGSDIFDIPGDVRLWWRVELIELIEGEKRFPFR